jgi:hypothetical protein
MLPQQLPRENSMMRLTGAILMAAGFAIIPACKWTGDRLIAGAGARVNEVRATSGSAPTLEPSESWLESRLSRDWLARSTRIESGDSVIFYRGSAQRTAPESEPWLGTVVGEVMYLSPKFAIVVPAGSLTLRAGDQHKATGRTYLRFWSAPPPYGHLLP